MSLVGQTVNTTTRHLALQKTKKEGGSKRRGERRKKEEDENGFVQETEEERRKRKQTQSEEGSSCGCGECLNRDAAEPCLPVWVSIQDSSSRAAPAKSCPSNFAMGKRRNNRLQSFNASVVQ